MPWGIRSWASSGGAWPRRRRGGRFDRHRRLHVQPRAGDPLRGRARPEGAEGAQRAARRRGARSDVAALPRPDGAVPQEQDLRPRLPARATCRRARAWSSGTTATGACTSHRSSGRAIVACGCASRVQATGPGRPTRSMRPAKSKASTRRRRPRPARSRRVGGTGGPGGTDPIAQVAARLRAGEISVGRGARAAHRRHHRSAARRRGAEGSRAEAARGAARATRPATRFSRRRSAG